MNIVKLCFGFFLGGFVFGIFVVAVLGWINDVKEDKGEKKRIEKVEDDLYCDDDSYKKEICHDHYVKLNIYGKERKFYIASTKIHRLYSADTYRQINGNIVSNVIGDKVEINLIEM